VLAVHVHVPAAGTVRAIATEANPASWPLGAPSPAVLTSSLRPVTLGELTAGATPIRSRWGAPVLAQAAEVTAVGASLKHGDHRFSYAAGTVHAGHGGAVEILLHPNANGRRIIARHHTHGWMLHVHLSVAFTAAAGTTTQTVPRKIEIFPAS
jgi:hypothetical protein